MVWKRKQRISAGDLASLLFEECVENQNQIIRMPRSDMDERFAQAFSEKARLYQLAAVMLALLISERVISNFTHVKRALESMTFPARPNDISDDLLSSLREAMSVLNQLISATSEERIQLSWARSWLGDIGIEESNPVVLYQVACQWMDFYIFLHDVLKKFDPRAA